MTQTLQILANCAKRSAPIAASKWFQQVLDSDSKSLLNPAKPHPHGTCYEALARKNHLWHVHNKQIDMDSI